MQVEEFMAVVDEYAALIAYLVKHQDLEKAAEAGYKRKTIEDEFKKGER